jgi:hypothetical protein
MSAQKGGQGLERRRDRPNSIEATGYARHVQFVMSLLSFSNSVAESKLSLLL